MKQKLLLMLFTLGVSLSAMARPDKEMLVCEGEQFSGVQVQLDSSGFVKNSGYTEAVSARMWYNFSGTRTMACFSTIRFNSYDIQCVGYYWPDEITELKVKNNEDDIIAEWTTSKVYGNIKMTTPCVLKEVKE